VSVGYGRDCAVTRQGGEPRQRRFFAALGGAECERLQGNTGSATHTRSGGQTLKAHHTMTEISASTASTVDERPAKFSASDGTALAGTWFEPSRPRLASTVVVIVCGAGIPARFYLHFAHYLCESGAAVLTFDYRGIGVSRQGNLRKLKSGMEDWAVRDIPAAFSEARERYPRLPLGAVAHSVGTLLLGAAPDASRIRRLIFFGPHTGYCRDYRARWRWLLYGVWHVSMPAVTKVV